MIRMNDFQAEPKELLESELKAAERVLRSGWFILGKEVEQFEKEWAIYCGAKFAVGVANGMDAIEIGLRTLEIGPGDEVITTPMTAAATVLAILRTGAIPVLADIDPTTALLDPNKAEACINSKTKAILLVHLYGQLRGMEKWKALCDAHNLFLLEDCAQAHGASEAGTKAGAFGIWGAYSFYPTKNLGGRGDAGALVTDSEEVAIKARRLRNYGQDSPYLHAVSGVNSRLDELQAAILKARLPWLDQFNKRRREIGFSYLRSISNPGVKLLQLPLDDISHVFHQFAVRVQNRSSFVAYLKAREVETLSHYPRAIHQQPFFQGRTPFPLSHAEAHAEHCVSIPCHPQLSDEAVKTVIAICNGYDEQIAK